jgi:hypothetical protein
MDQSGQIRFDPVELTDCAGEAHVFHFQTNFFGPASRWMRSSFAMGVRLATISSDR